MNAKITIPIAVIISVIVTAGIMYSVGGQQEPQQVQTSPPEIIYVEKQTSKFFDGTHEIREISSQEELKNIIDASSSFGSNFYDDRMFVRNLAVEEMATFDATESFRESSGPVPAGAMLDTQSKNVEYSTTNVQVANVDEPDYIKNDSKYVYIVSKNTLSIIDAHPAESAELILKIALDIESQYIQNMFLNDNRLVIFYNGQSDDEIIPQYDFIPRRSYSPVTHALIIDVSDKENPTILKDYSIEGHFRDARMIGNYAYFVTNNNIDYQYPRLPIILESSIPIMTARCILF